MTSEETLAELEQKALAATQQEWWLLADGDSPEDVDYVKQAERAEGQPSRWTAAQESHPTGQRLPGKATSLSARLPQYPPDKL